MDFLKDSAFGNVVPAALTEQMRGPPACDSISEQGHAPAQKRAFVLYG